MTRLSDHLRGLADRAPVADSVVSVEVASRRIHRQRRLRASANAVAGLGAAAVIAVAAISPGAGAKNAAADALNPTIAGGSSNDSAAISPEDSTRLAWGLCGTYPLTDPGEVSTADSLSLGAVPVDIDGGTTLAVDATLVPASSGEVETFGPQAWILWNGMVVASGTAEAAQSGVLSLTAGVPVEQTVSADLVDCWEGAPLPGGEYQMLAVQELYTDITADPVLPPEPTGQPGMPVEPTVAPEPGSGTSAPATDDAAAQDGAVAPPPPGVAVSDGTVTGSGLASDAVSVTRVVSEPVDFAIAGEVPEDPFGQYLPAPVAPIETPDDLLTPAAARDGFAANVTSTPWAMEAGTQRVVKVNDSTDRNSETAWAQNYFGCAWDARMSAGFPATNATWDLLEVSATVPRTIDVSYGWVVEDNPTVDLKVTNVSGYTLPGYWGSDPNTALVLVRDGTVVAEGYPVPARRGGTFMETAQDGMLSPGDSLEGTYLWREVNGCSTGVEQADVTPGVYTVLNVQSIYVDSGQPYYPDPLGGGIDGPVLDAPTAGKEAATFGNPGASSDSARGAIAPAPGDYDSIELQVWTSLGTVTVR